MEDFTKGANPAGLAIKNIMITDATHGVGEDHLRASLAAICDHKEPVKINPSFPSYYRLIGEKLELRAASNGVSKSFAEISFKNDAAPSHSQISKLMGSINPAPKKALKQKDNLQSRP